jgi:isoleucyl-tRNA synthetase
LTEALVGKLFGDEEIKIIAHQTGKQLKGKRYAPLFTFVPPSQPAHFVILGDFVTTEDGSGMVHIAPAFGEDDMRMAVEQDLPVIMTVLPNGTFIPDVRPWAGKFVKDADPLIIEDLHNRGLLFKSALYTHTYPFCWRCDTPLLYYAAKPGISVPASLRTGWWN